MEHEELPDDYLSPRSKVAKMLAEIDDAPTPLHSRQTSPQAAINRCFEEETASQADVAPEVTRSPKAFLSEQNALSEEDEDEDILPRKAFGRAARRMLEQRRSDAESPDCRPANASPRRLEDDNEADLYSPTSVKLATPSRGPSQPTASPGDSQNVPTTGKGLFVSPSKSDENSESDESDFLSNLATGTTKLAQVVAAKRRERLAKEAEPTKHTSGESNEEASDAHAMSDLPEANPEYSQEAPENLDVERILSDAARPTRKAGKRALLEMERETQRFARQQALAHQMKVKKKFSTSELFARFNFRQTVQQPESAPADNIAESSSSSAQNSDGAEAASGQTVPREPVSTPPSSPPTPWDTQKAMVERGALAKMVPVREDSLASLIANPMGDDEDLPDIAERMRPSQPARTLKAQPTPLNLPAHGIKTQVGKSSPTPQGHRPQSTSAQPDSDDELDIIHPMPAYLSVFDRVKPVGQGSEKHSKAIHMLKHLAQLSRDDTASARKKYAGKSIPPQVLNSHLMKMAKAKAHEAQLDRLAELKAKGVVVMTAEEQEREAEQIENLLEKARLEAQQLAKKERAAARNDSGGEDGMVASDGDDDDEDWEGASEEDADDQTSQVSDNDGLLDDAAEETEDEGEESDEENAKLSDGGEEEVVSPALPLAEDDDVLGAMNSDPESTKAGPIPRRGRKSHVIEEDDDDDDVDHPSLTTDEATPAMPALATAPDDPFAAFHVSGAKSAVDLMSPTQAFNATMQTVTQVSQSQNANSLFTFGRSSGDNIVPPPTFAPPGIDPQTGAGESQSQLVPASQVPQQTQEVRLDWETQLPETPVPAVGRAGSHMMETPDWEPSQDAGLPSPWTVARRPNLEGHVATGDAGEEYETQSTLRMRVSESPDGKVTRKRGKLVKGMRIVSDDETEVLEQDVPAQTRRTKNAFSEMRRRRLDSLNAAERAEAEKEMRSMMEEQAEESEDEYAGLGGDDTEMIAPETAEDRAMIDETHIDVDERELAKLYAQRQRVAEEEATNKLFKDLTTGALRRRQGAGWELDEDEEDVIARRRQMKQREEARKRKLLLQDENVKDLLQSGGDSKGREAFLRAMADDDDGDDPAGMPDDADENSSTPATQDDSQNTQKDAADPEPLREVSSNKRTLHGSRLESARPSAKVRRVQYDDVAFSHPTSQLQVRESLSFLLDEPDQPAFGPTSLEQGTDGEEDGGATPQSDSDDAEDDAEVDAEVARQNDGGFASNPARMEAMAMPPPPLPTDRLPASQRRTPAKATVVDRLSLKRAGSSSSHSSGRSAWSTASGAGGKVPSLLRKATSNLSAAGSTNDRGVSFSNGSANANERGVSTGSAGGSGRSQKSSLAYQARAEERKAIVERAERKRAEGRQKVAELRRRQGGSLVGGAFGSVEWE